MTPDGLKLILVLAVLFIVCTIYAIVLDRHPHWYLPRNRTWITVVIGNSFIVLAQVALYWWGITLTPSIIFLTNATAGAPIIVWQLVRGAANGAEARAHRQ